MQMGSKNADDVTMYSCCSVHLGASLTTWLRSVLELAGPEQSEHALCFLVFSRPCFAAPTHVAPSGRLQLLLAACFHGLFPCQCQEQECGLTAATDWGFVFLVKRTY